MRLGGQGDLAPIPEAPVVWVRGIVQEFGEGSDVRSVETDKG